MKIKEICNVLESFAPPALQESYDNSGLLIGDNYTEVSAALICLDLTEEVIEEAIGRDCRLIISHHPLIFKGLKRITNHSMVERIISKAIKNDIAIYAIHTNLDNVANGVNGILCKKLGLINCSILKPVSGLLKKLVTFCPVREADRVRLALFDAGAGRIGNYDSCSFNTEGSGTFRGLEGSNPYTGKINEFHTESEIRIETIYPGYLEGKVLDALHSSHPYEEIAFDIFPLSNTFPTIGSGMIGMPEKEMTDDEFLSHAKNILGTGVIRHTALKKKKLRKVAVCGGSGAFLIPEALRAEADLFLTADIKYHDFFDHEERMVIADAGHYETEQFTRELISNIIKEKFPNFAVRISGANTNPLHYL